MSLVPVKALHVSILSRIITFRYSRDRIPRSYIYMHVSRACDNDVAATILRFSEESSDIYICKLRMEVLIFAIKETFFLRGFIFFRFARYSLFLSFSVSLCVTPQFSLQTEFLCCAGVLAIVALSRGIYTGI